MWRTHGRTPTCSTVARAQQSNTGIRLRQWGQQLPTRARQWCRGACVKRTSALTMAVPRLEPAAAGISCQTTPFPCDCALRKPTWQVRTYWESVYYTGGTFQIASRGSSCSGAKVLCDAASQQCQRKTPIAPDAVRHGTQCEYTSLVTREPLKYCLQQTGTTLLWTRRRMRGSCLGRRLTWRECTAGAGLLQSRTERHRHGVSKYVAAAALQ